MAITFHGLASTPADEGSNASSPTTITPPGSMSSGDLVVVICHNRLTTDTHAVSQAGGQTWTKLTTNSSGTNTVTWFYCVFNGTWDANPSFSHGATNNTCMMVVFRPTSGYQWREDVAENPTDFTAPGSPYDVTVTGITAGTASVAIASWSSSDDNDWAYQAGTSWTQPTGGSVDNNSGQDSSDLVAYRLMPSGGSTGSPVGRQVSNGGDAGCWNIMSFQEFSQTTYNESQTDAGNAVDSPTAVQETQSSQTEAATAVDTNQDAQGSYNVAQTEAATAVDTNQDATGTYAGSQTEAGNAVDIPSAAQVTSSSQTEAGNAVEVTDAGMVTERDITEAGNAVDVPAVTVHTRASAITEAASAVDTTQNGLRTTTASQTENGNAVDTPVAGSLNTNASQTEAASAVDTNQSAVKTTASSQTEAGNAVEVTDAPGTSYHVSQTDAGSAVDIHDAEQGGVLSATQDETAGATDSSTATGTFNVAQTDAGSAVDVPNFGSLATNASQTEAGNAVEASTVSAIRNETITEPANAVEAPQAQQIFSAARVEATTAVDTSQGGSIGNAAQTEAANAVEVTNSDMAPLEAEGDLTIILMEVNYSASASETAYTTQLSDRDRITAVINYSDITVQL